MNTTTHGISFNVENVNHESLLVMSPYGKLTHEDHHQLLPLLESAIKKSDSQVKLLVDISQLQGWEPRAVWDDLRMGFKHGKDFEKIALVGHKPWQETAAKVSDWFIRGESRSFHDRNAAVHWLTKDD